MNFRELEDAKRRFYCGESDDAYRFMGAHRLTDRPGYSFRVWAPNARSVRLVGDFNFWNTEELFMQKDFHGVWEIESGYAKEGDRYQYYIERADGSFVYKSDPYAFSFEPLPGKASVLYDFRHFSWTDDGYRRNKNRIPAMNQPVNIYEVHLGSWRRKEDGSFYSYREVARELIPYLKKMRYTHVEFLPLTEYPFEGSWGYQVTGYFAPTRRYGMPEDFMALVDACHAANIGVILDWVPAHFPKDESGLYEFDGTPCYEGSDPKMNEHKEWNTRIFDYGRFEVLSFLVSGAAFWIREYHVDGIRVDAVASMLYLDYARTDFTPNRYGGNLNLEAIEFLRRMNRAAFAADPSVLMIAEDSTAFPLVTKPGEAGGLGFNFKWNMGWMNDFLDYMSADPLFRKGRHNEMTFSLAYAFSENYVLPLSHDEVVHGKRSLIGKMPGCYEDQFANLRLLYGFMMAHPGKKLNFMGNEFAQFIEWDYKKALDWLLLDYDAHRAMQTYVRELNDFYLRTPAFWDREDSYESFSWISADDRDNSVAAFRRIAADGSEMICVFNFCPVLRKKYRIGLPVPGKYVPVFCSQRKRYGAAVPIRLMPVKADPVPMHGYDYSGSFTVPPLSAIYFKIEDKE